MSTDLKSISSSLLPEFDLEMAGTRKVLERVRDEDWTFKPHAKSFSMGELAGHVATIPAWLTGTLNAPSFDMAPGGVPAEFPRPGSAREALALFLEGVKAARAALEATADPAFADEAKCNQPPASWQPVEALKTKLTGEGWTIKNVKTDEGCYEVYATDKDGTP